MKRIRPLALAALTSVAFAACSDSNVPFFTAPTSVPNSPPGIQNAVTGLVSSMRGNDLFQFMVDLTGYARDGANYTNTEPRFITYELGLIATDPAWSGAWDNFYADILFSHQILATLPTVQPAYSSAQVAALTGVIQTLEAYNYMMLAEDHDTNGIAIQPAAPTNAPPGYCIKDAWKYIVALLDSANAQLMTAGATPIPVKLPSGFSSVSATGGSFSSFNRALAGKAGLELAYAIARSTPGGTPGLMTPGAPDQAALVRADSALTASTLYSPANLGPTPAGGFTPDAHSVLHNFSAVSGDVVNPMNANIGTYVVLTTIPSSQDTINDLRWKTKFIANPNPIQESGYASAASPYIYDMYSTPGAFIPIVRNEELVLVRAQIQIGLTNYATAAGLINAVRQNVGGLAAATIPTTYPGTRDALLHEQQISTAFEASADRMISIRMYNLAVQLDTTWGAKDLHTTVNPIPFAEVAARGGTFTKSCP
jgi:hypothetical protein